MSLASTEDLVEQRVAQLEAISTRRNELLRQMYHMMRRRNDVGPVLTLEEAGDRDLQGFLQRFDIAKDLDIGSITHLSENSLPSEDQLQSIASPTPPSPTLDKSDLRRATRSQSRVTSYTKSPSPGSSKPPSASLPNVVDQSMSSSGEGATPDQRMDMDAEPDELDLIGSPLSDDEKKQKEDEEHHHEIAGVLEPPLSSQNEEETEGARASVKLSETEEDEDAMKVDVPLEEVISSQAKEAAPVEAVAVGVLSQNLPQKREAALEDADVHMEGSENGPGSVPEEKVSQTIDGPTSFPPQSATLPSSNEPIKSSIPFVYLGPSSPIQPTPIPRPPVIVLAPSTSMDTTSFTFDESPFVGPEQPKTPNSPIIHRHQYNPDYTLPQLKKLPPEFNRKVKTKSRRKEKEKENGRKEEWFPMGINKWSFTLNANPVWKRVSRPTKCLSSREWAVAMTELKLIRTFDRIDSLKDGGRWSFRQPKKQRGVGGLVKTHWDYLMDEMKWMRIDFREERRWKMALAYTLATAVMEWHAAGSLEERVKSGICVLWNPAYLKSDEPQGEQQSDDLMQPEVPDSQESQLPGQKASALLGVDYGSDEEEDEDQQDVVDALQPQILLEDALESPSQEDDTHGDQEALIKPKTEESEDTSALQLNNSTQLDTQRNSQTMDHPMADPEEKDFKEDLVGLKSTSKDPILAAKSSSNSSSNNGDSDAPTISTKSSFKQAYAPLRERILESDIDKLFLDLDDFHITQPSDAKDDAKDDELHDPIVIDLLPADLSTIFPDLHPLGLLDIAPPAPVLEGRKKAEKRSDRDDPNKRIEDTTYTKLFPVGQFMYTKPTLIGALQPSKNWRDDRWSPLDETPVYVEYEGPTRPPEDMMSEIFDNRLSNSAILAQQQLMFAAARERDKDRRRATEHQWSVNDDTLLKTLIDRYPYNWQLISESFNATRTTTPTDKRTARDCFERWREKWAPEVRRHPELPQQPSATPAQEEAAAASTSQMTTRGVKRLASSMAANPVTNSSGGSEPKKRRRHILLQETIRRSAKKKVEFQQKMLGTQRKPSTIHETHGPFNNMRHFSPAELSRMKAEKDAKTTHEIQLRKRQEEVNRAAQLQARLTPLQQQLLQQQQQQQPQSTQPAQQSQQTGTPTQTQGQQQTQPQQGGQQTAQPVQAQAQAVSVAQPAAQQVPQSAQVANIAQRSQNTLLANQALGAPRLTPQQILQLQQQVRPGSQPTQSNQVAGHPLGQQGQILVPSLNGNSNALNGAHLTASFVSRDSTSSPAHVSPPRKSATPTNINSPRITADQTQHGQVQMGISGAQVAGSVLARPPANLNYYNTITGLTPEQLNVLRYMHQHHQQQQQQQQTTQQDGQG